MARYEDKKARLQELFAEQERIEQEIKKLLEPEKVTTLPRGFSMSVEVLRIIKEAGVDGVTPQEILEKLQNEYPAYGIDREKVASALAYLKNDKKQVDTPTRGVYRVVTQQETPAMETGVSV